MRRWNRAHIIIYNYKWMSRYWGPERPGILLLSRLPHKLSLLSLHDSQRPAGPVIPTCLSHRHPHISTLIRHPKHTPASEKEREAASLGHLNNSYSAIHEQVAFSKNQAELVTTQKTGCRLPSLHPLPASTMVTHLLRTTAPAVQ